MDTTTQQKNGFESELDSEFMIYPLNIWKKFDLNYRAKLPENGPPSRFGIGDSFLLKKDNETVVVPESVLDEPPPPPPPLEEESSRNSSENPIKLLNHLFH